MSTRPDDHRRKWDKDEFERIATERLKAELEEEEERAKKKRMNGLISRYKFKIVLMIHNINV